MTWAGYVTHMGERKAAYRDSIERRKKTLGRPRHKWVDNIKEYATKRVP